MTVLSDKWIKQMALEREMIKPFIEKQNGPSMCHWPKKNQGRKG